MIYQDQNLKNVFIRDLILSFIKDVDKKLQYTVKFSDKNKEYQIPVFYALHGDKQMALDAFVEDMPSGKKVDFHHDFIPRIVYSFSDLSIKTNESSNPHIRFDIDVNGKAYNTKVRWLPCDVNLNANCIFTTQLEAFQFMQIYIETHYHVNFFRFEHAGLPIECAYKIPDSFSPGIVYEGAGSDDSKIKLEFSTPVTTKMPIINYDPDVMIPAYQKIDTLTQRVIDADAAEEADQYYNPDRDSDGNEE